MIDAPSYGIHALYARMQHLAALAVYGISGGVRALVRYGAIGYEHAVVVLGLHAFAVGYFKDGIFHDRPLLCRIRFGRVLLQDSPAALLIHGIPSGGQLLARGHIYRVIGDDVRSSFLGGRSGRFSDEPFALDFLRNHRIIAVAEVYRIHDGIARSGIDNREIAGIFQSYIAVFQHVYVVVNAVVLHRLVHVVIQSDVIAAQRYIFCHHGPLAVFTYAGFFVRSRQVIALGIDEECYTLAGIRHQSHAVAKGRCGVILIAYCHISVTICIPPQAVLVLYGDNAFGKDSVR